MLDSIAQDLRIAVRGFARKPALFCLAVIAIAAGVGATTTIYSVVRGVLLRPLPYVEPDRLVRVGQVSEDASRIRKEGSYLPIGLSEELGIWGNPWE